MNCSSFVDDSRPTSAMNQASGIPRALNLNLLKQPSDFLVDDTLYIQIVVEPQPSPNWCTSSLLEAEASKAGMRQMKDNGNSWLIPTMELLATLVCVVKWTNCSLILLRHFVIRFDVLLKNLFVGILCYIKITWILLKCVAIFFIKSSW